ncbi:MAG: Lsr2 family protein [Cellulomonadaceae bacterium]|nr:Lsr2 family protein [Cellulomonadaceae bacterium]
MAQRASLVADMSSEPADESIDFSPNGMAYQVDATTVQAAQLRAAIAPWVGHGRTVPSSGAPRHGRRAAGCGPSANELRTWLRANGHTAGDRGRVQPSLLDASAAGH